MYPNGKPQTEAEWEVARASTECPRCGDEKSSGDNFCLQCHDALLVEGERQEADEQERAWERFCDRRQGYGE